MITSLLCYYVITKFKFNFRPILELIRPWMWWWPRPRPSRGQLYIIFCKLMELLTTPFLPLRISKRLKCGYFKFKLQKNIHEYSWILKFMKSGDFDKKCWFWKSVDFGFQNIFESGDFEKVEILSKNVDSGFKNILE